MGTALLSALLSHARTSHHTLAVLIEGGHDDDGNSSLQASLFFNACGFRPSPRGALPRTLLLRPSDASHPARLLPREAEADVASRYKADWAVNAAVAAEKAEARKRGTQGAALRRYMAEYALSERLRLEGPLAAASHAADVAELRKKWPRAVAAARAAHLPEVHLLNVKPSRAGMLMFQDDALNWHMVMYDAFGPLTAERAAELGVPPHPRYRNPGGTQGPGCSVM